MILESLAGALTVEDACARLGLARSRFYELREKALQAALDGLAPGIPGRPRKVREHDARRVVELSRRVSELEIDLAAERVRSEMALVMPHVLREAGAQQQRGDAWLALTRATRSARGQRRATTRG